VRTWTPSFLPFRKITASPVLGDKVIHFPRGALAQELVAALRGQAVFGDAHNGLFLAEPRRAARGSPRSFRLI
jgi:hypothetical protein